MTRVLLVAKDWHTRALLRAQLLEEGVDVEAFETVADALASLDSSDVLPGLLVADLSASENPSAEIDALTQWADQIPIWIIASRSLITEKSLKGRGFEMTLFRPVDVGELVGQIKRRAEP